MSVVSLKELLRKRVMEDMIKAVQPAAKWKLLVVDSSSAKLLNTICKSHEILQENVTGNPLIHQVIEDMSQKRQPFPNYEAIYFVTPTVKTIDRIINDFKQEKPLYLAAHIYFISSLDDSLFDKIKKSGTSKYIKSLKEMNIDFIALEQQLFSFDMPLSLFPLYSPSSFSQQSVELEKISKKLLSLFVTLGDSPSIRYYNPNGNNDGISAKLAHILQKDLDDFQAADSSFPATNDYKRTILLITDRSFDMMAPFLHEFTYQAMMQDLVVGDKSKHPSELQSAGITHPLYFSPLSAYNMLDENDTIWTLIRHWHFAEAVDYILNSFTKFLSENKAASSAMGGNGVPTGLDALKTMKDTLNALPQFQSLKQKYSIHINLCQECKVLFERRNLDLVASVQQDLATGETADGKTLKNAMLDLIPVLDNKNTSSSDKVRALMVYIIAMNGVQDLERKRLLETAKVSAEDSQAITNMSLFNVVLSSAQASKKKDKDKYSYWGSYKQERKKKKSKAEDALPYDLSRYVPLMKRLVEDQISNSIPTEHYPWVKEPKPEELGISSNALKMFRFTSNGIVPPDPNYPLSLRTTRASWSGRGRVQKSSAEKGKEQLDWRKNGSRIILFSLGGLTYSEIRSMYELSKESQREIFFGNFLYNQGSTFVYNPIQFLDVLKDLHKIELPQLPVSPSAGPLPEPDKKEDKKAGLFSKKK